MYASVYARCMRPVYAVYALVYANLEKLGNYKRFQVYVPPKNSIGCNLLCFGVLQPMKVMLSD